MLEQIGRVGRRAAAEDQLGLDQAVHRVGQLCLRQGGQGGDRAVVEAAADDRGGLGHLLDRLQAIEPRHQRVVQRCGDRQRAQRSVEVKGVGTLAQHAQFDDRLGHLLDEQRHAVGPRGDLVEQRLRQALAAGGMRDDRLDRGAREPVQCQARDHRMAAEGRNKDRTRGDHHEHACALHAIQRQLDQLQGRRIDPVRILDHPQHGPAAGEPGQLIDQHGERAAAALLRRQRQRAVAARPVETRERRHQRRRLADIVRGPGEQGLEPVQSAISAVVRGEAGGMGELLNHRVKRGVRVVGRALVAQQEVRLAGDGLDQGLGDPRLADPGLAGEQDHLPFTGLGLPPALDQQGELVIAADDRRHAVRLPGCEAGLERALGEHHEGGCRFLEPLEGLRSERAQHEQIAEQATDGGTSS